MVSYTQIQMLVESSLQGNTELLGCKVFPLRGKLLNVREINQKALAENKEARIKFHTHVVELE